MKVILLEELKGKGGEGDVVDVARGFAVNFLFPRKLAVEATAGNLKQLQARMGNIRRRDAERHAAAEGLAAAIEGKTVLVEAKAGDGGRLYGSVTSMMIAEAIAAQLGVEVDRRRMEVHGHIKTAGEHPVSVAVFQDVKAEVIVKVVPIGATPEEVVAFEAAAAATEAAEEAVAAAKAEAETAEAEPAEEPAEESAEDAEDDE